MKRVAFFTGTRADYGLLKESASAIGNIGGYSTGFIVAGNHFSESFGNTHQFIRADGFDSWAEVNVNTSLSVTEQNAQMMVSLERTGVFQSIDCLVILGDRYEAFAAAQVCFFNRVPLVHLHAGEKTEGAQDDFLRHSISQLATYLIAATPGYARRCYQLGAAPEYVFQLGSPAQDNIATMEKICRSDFAAEMGMADKPFVLMTAHPETHSPDITEKLIPEIKSALVSYPELSILATYPNADEGHEVIIDQLKSWQLEQSERVTLVPNLGLKRYLQAVDVSEFVIGNSSSGLLEVPSLHRFTIDVGDRQRGREHADSVINCAVDSEKIRSAIGRVEKMKFDNRSDCFANPYGEPGFALRFSSWLQQQFELGGFKSPVRRFYDVNQQAAGGQ